MKNIKWTFVLLLSTFLNFAQNIEGDWYGALAVQGQKLRLVFHIKENDGQYVSTMDSPDQKAFGIKVASTTFESTILNIEMPQLKLIFKGKSNQDFSEIVGTLIQMGNEMPLKLSRNAIDKIELIRPQTPQAPFDYQVEEVTFTNIKDNVSLSGTLTYPNSEAKFPAVVLISGSGPQDRNEEIFEHKSFAVIADELTKKGIAVLRYDDRGVGKSTGDFKNSTSADFANDVRAAILFLKSRPEINPNKIGLIGHSEGGMIAPMVAVNSKDIHFIVLMAGPGTPIDELLIAQSTRYAQLQGADQMTIEQNKIMQENIYAFIKEYRSDHLEDDLKEYLTIKMQNLPETIKPKTEEALNSAVNSQVETVTSKWFLYFLKYNPADNLSKLKCSVLAMNGSLDFQVPAKPNLTAIENALIKGKNKNFKIIELPSLNHLFQEATTGSLEEYAKIEQTISPNALSVMSEWILKQTN